MDKEWLNKQLYVCNEDYTNMLNKCEIYFKDSFGRMVDTKGNKFDLKEEAIEKYFTPIETAYKDAEIYTTLVIGELYMISRDTKDSDTKRRLNELIKGLDSPKLVRRTQGLVKVDSE